LRVEEPHKKINFDYRRNHQLRHFGFAMVFTHDMSDWLGFTIDKQWLEDNIAWKDFETGVRLGKLKREEKCSLVLYDANSEVSVDAFMPHMHPGGEAYLVLEGEVWDDDGTYPTGSIVWMDKASKHNPKTRGRTLILVLWPEGVKIV
tara:strand:+ start:817 stop:1257 length:441 start_codon:yes stop_codon:yes gene_type:complete